MNFTVCMCVCVCMCIKFNAHNFVVFDIITWTLCESLSADRFSSYPVCGYLGRLFCIFARPLLFQIVVFPPYFTFRCTERVRVSFAYFLNFRGANIRWFHHDEIPSTGFWQKCQANGNFFSLSNFYMNRTHISLFHSIQCVANRHFLCHLTVLCVELS